MAGRDSEPSGRASELAWRPSEPAGRAFKPAGRALEPDWSDYRWVGPRGDGEKKRKTEYSRYMVIP